jgi:hypothetical protein
VESLAGAVVVACAVFQAGLAGVIVFKPRVAERFLESFASSARAHYLEQALRLIAGVAIVIFAPSMWYSDLFNFFGWIIIVTTMGLLLIPWQWHHEFAKWAIPVAIRHMKLFAFGAAALAAFIFYGVSRAVLS